MHNILMSFHCIFWYFLIQILLFSKLPLITFDRFTDLYRRMAVYETVWYSVVYEFDKNVLHKRKRHISITKY